MAINSKIWNGILLVIKNLMVICNFMVMLIVFTALTSREVFNVDFYGYEEILVIFAMWLYMMGSAYGSYEKTQITADIVNIMMPEGKAKSSIRLLAHLITFLLGVIFAIWAFQFILWSFQMNIRTPIYGLPSLIGESSLFFGLLLMSLYNFVYLVDEIKATIKTFSKSSHHFDTDRGALS